MNGVRQGLRVITGAASVLVVLILVGELGRSIGFPISGPHWSSGCLGFIHRAEITV